MAPIVDRPWWQLVAALDHPHMLAEDMPFGSDHQALRVDPQADRAVGERRRNAVAIAFEADQASGRDTLAMLDEPVEGRRQRH